MRLGLSCAQLSRLGIKVGRVMLYGGRTYVVEAFEGRGDTDAVWAVLRPVGPDED